MADEYVTVAPIGAGGGTQVRGVKASEIDNPNYRSVFSSNQVVPPDLLVGYQFDEPTTNFKYVGTPTGWVRYGEAAAMETWRIENERFKSGQEALSVQKARDAMQPQGAPVEREYELGGQFISEKSPVYPFLSSYTQQLVKEGVKYSGVTSMMLAPGPTVTPAGDNVLTRLYAVTAGGGATGTKLSEAEFIVSGSRPFPVSQEFERVSNSEKNDLINTVVFDDLGQGYSTRMAKSEFAFKKTLTPNLFVSKQGVYFNSLNQGYSFDEKKNLEAWIKFNTPRPLVTGEYYAYEKMERENPWIMEFRRKSQEIGLPVTLLGGYEGKGTNILGFNTKDVERGLYGIPEAFVGQGEAAAITIPVFVRGRFLGEKIPFSQRVELREKALTTGVNLFFIGSLGAPIGGVGVKAGGGLLSQLAAKPAVTGALLGAGLSAGQYALEPDFKESELVSRVITGAGVGGIYGAVYGKVRGFKARSEARIELRKLETTPVKVSVGESFSKELASGRIGNVQYSYLTTGSARSPSAVVTGKGLNIKVFEKGRVVFARRDFAPSTNFLRVSKIGFVGEVATSKGVVSFKGASVGRATGFISGEGPQFYAISRNVQRGIVAGKPGLITKSTSFTVITDRSSTLTRYAKNTPIPTEKLTYSFYGRDYADEPIRTLTFKGQTLAQEGYSKTLGRGILIKQPNIPKGVFLSNRGALRFEQITPITTGKSATSQVSLIRQLQRPASVALPVSVSISEVKSSAGSAIMKSFEATAQRGTSLVRISSLSQTNTRDIEITQVKTRPSNAILYRTDARETTLIQPRQITPQINKINLIVLNRTQNRLVEQPLTRSLNETITRPTSAELPQTRVAAATITRTATQPVTRTITKQTVAIGPPFNPNVPPTTPKIKVPPGGLPSSQPTSWRPRLTKPLKAFGRRKKERKRLSPFADLLSKTKTEARFFRAAKSPSERTSVKYWLKSYGLFVPTAEMLKRKK